MMHSLFSQLKPGSLILTPNQRLTATLLKHYNQEQMQQDLRSWPTPAIRPLSAWIQELWDDYCAREMDGDWLVLSPNQELILWEELLAQSPESEHLLKLSDLAKQAKSAWTTLKQWRSDYYHPSFSFTENGRYFQMWAEKFKQRCQTEKWIDSASLLDVLIEKIRTRQVKLPQELIFFNFTELTPQQQEFVAACQEQGVVIQNIDQQAEQPLAYHIGLSDEEAEIQAMARWAKQLILEHPEASIGCIFSQLEEKRDLILSVFKDLFDQPEFYNISAGKNLAAYPILQQALQLLNLSVRNISFTNFNSLLASPYLGDADNEMVKRIQWDSYLRRRNFNNGRWEIILEDENAPACPKLKARLHSFLHLRENQASTQSISQWMHHFSILLETLGWPGEQSLNSHEYQVVKAWLDLLLETASLDHFLPVLNYRQALHYLNVLAAKTYFQPESPQAPIQILGQLEGAGLPFDYSWVAGLDDTAWPPAPSPNPLIPHELQKALSMPNASAGRQLEYSLRMMTQFKQAAKQVLFSYAQRGDSDEKQASPLIAPLAKMAFENLKLAPYQARLKTIFQTRDLESCQDDQAPPLQVQEKLQGGASIFEMQAACPFKAFAKLRLGAKSLEETQAGLPAKNRGTVIHKALELFWKEIENHQNLKALSPQEEKEILDRVLGTALDQASTYMDKQSLYHTLVKQRLEKTLLAWLELEKARPPFKVAALEQEKIISVDNQSISIRVDRIDELANGDKLIIDYKTRKSCDTQAWFSDRPDEPQLPLYCISSDESISAIAFAQLHSHKTEIKGLASQDLNIEGIKTLTEKSRADAADWALQVQQWRENLNRLFHDFQNGKATVDPKNLDETCRYCDLQTLCRIHEERVLNYDN